MKGACLSVWLFGVAAATGAPSINNVGALKLRALDGERSAQEEEGEEVQVLSLLGQGLRNGQRNSQESRIGRNLVSQGRCTGKRRGHGQTWGITFGREIV